MHVTAPRAPAICTYIIVDGPVNCEASATATIKHTYKTQANRYVKF